MNGNVFTDWFECQLLPQLNNPTVTVRDNASYDNVKVPETVTLKMSKKKRIVQTWLTEHFS